MTGWRAEAEDVLREVRDYLADNRERLIHSYCTPSRDGQDYDIETIDDRHAYNAVVRYAELIEIIDRRLAPPLQPEQTGDS